MKKVLIIAALILAALLAVALAVFFIAAHLGSAPGNETPAGSDGVSFPTPGGSDGTFTTVPLRDSTGGTIEAHDFIHTGDTVPDPVNPGTYLLAGSLTYCDPGVDCTAAPTPNYTILYNEKENSFAIGLLTEPLGAARKEAEQFLMAKLGISEKEMCALNYYLGTAYWVNEKYAADNLGFSFCPGAVKLP